MTQPEPFDLLWLEYYLVIFVSELEEKPTFESGILTTMWPNRPYSI